MIASRRVRVLLPGVVASWASCFCLAGCGAEENRRQEVMAEAEPQPQLSKEFVLEAPIQEVEKAVTQWQDLGRKAASGLKEIALSTARNDEDRRRAVQLLMYINLDDAERWYGMNLTLRLGWHHRGVEGLENYPCAEALTGMGWLAVPNLVRAAENSYFTEEWRRIAARVIYLIARKKARSAIAAIEAVDTGLQGLLPEK